MRAFRVNSLVFTVMLMIAAAGLYGSAQSGADVEVEGTLEVLVEDHAQGAIVHHVLETATERIWLIEAPGRSELSALTTGSRIRARGRRGPNRTLELKPGSSGSDSSITTLGLASPNTFGQQQVAVILVNFQDKATTPYSWTHAHDVTFNQVSNFYLENSYGQTSLAGDVFGWFTIAMNSTVCDYNQIASLADQAASRAGVDLNTYSRRVYAFPTNACSWWGLGTVGGNPSRAWIKGSYALKVVAHELGHNLGDWHSNSQPCDSTGCTFKEYGDDRDTMGGPGTGHFSAYQKERLGWLNYGSSPAIQTVTGSGTYFINSLQTAGAGAKALKVLKSGTSSGNTYYYVEARTRTGYDSGYAGGVILHTGMDSNGNSAFQIDLDRITSGFDAVLDPGQTYTDTAAAFSVRTISTDATGAWVAIDYAGLPCTARAPGVSLSPSGTITTSPSATTNFTLSVKNNDDSTCAPAGFSIAMSVPSGWGWASGMASISVAPGTTFSVPVSVTAPDWASGMVTVGAQLARPGGAGPGGSATVNLMVVSDLSVTLAVVGGSRFQFTATVLAGQAPAAGVPVTFVMTGPTGATTRFSATTDALGAATVKGRFRPRDPKGAYQVTATATSGNLTGTATGSFVY